MELENQLEQEQEALVNRLWKRMDKLEAEKRFLLLLFFINLPYFVELFGVGKMFNLFCMGIGYVAKICVNNSVCVCG